MNGQDAARLAGARFSSVGMMAVDASDYAAEDVCMTQGHAIDMALNAAQVVISAFSALCEKYTPSGRWGRVQGVESAFTFPASDAASVVNRHVPLVGGGSMAAP